MYVQRRLVSLGIRLVWSESSLSVWRNVSPWLPFERLAKTLIRLGGCPGLSESSLGTHVLSWFPNHVCILFWSKQVSYSYSPRFNSAHRLSNFDSVYIRSFAIIVCRFYVPTIDQAAIFATVCCTGDIFVVFFSTNVERLTRRFFPQNMVHSAVHLLYLRILHPREWRIVSSGNWPIRLRLWYSDIQSRRPNSVWYCRIMSSELR